MTEVTPPEDILRILAQMEEDPKDWTRIDLCRILDGCGICCIENLGGGMGGPEMRSHPQAADIRILVWPAPGVSAATIRHVLHCVGMLRSRGLLRRA